jgi:prepilin-type N-terminal cleavage/methylation domain-containing protein
MKKRNCGFTLAELLVAIAVLVLLIVLFGRMMVATTSATTSAGKRMDVAAEIRPLWNRIGVDFSQMIKRSDVTYYVKIGSNEPGDDLIAFFSLVDGFYSSTTGVAEVRQPQTTLISYRINSQHQLERMAKSLPFAGQASQTPLVFGSAHTLSTEWPSAISATSSDSDFVVVGADVFRFEYYYLLKSNGATSDAPWASMSQVNVADIAAIAVCVAVIDPKSRKLISVGEPTVNANLKSISDAMVDYTPSMGTTGLLAQWQSVLDSSSLAKPGLTGIRLYQRIFPL